MRYDQAYVEKLETELVDIRRRLGMRTAEFWREQEGMEAVVEENAKLRKAGQGLANFVECECGTCDIMDDWEKAKGGAE